MGFWASIKQIWTIARHSILQAIRMKVVIILIAFILILVPSLPFVLKGDDTLVGQIRMVLAYCTYLISFLLCVLTIFLSAATLNNEIKDKQILLLDPKPIPRSVVLIGKWLGVMIINVVLLAAMLGVNYGLVRWMGRYRPLVISDVDRKIMAKSPLAVQQKMLADYEMAAKRCEQDHELLKANLFAARMIVRPPKPDIEAQVDAKVELIKSEGRMPERRTEEWVRRVETNRLLENAWRIPPHGTHEWTFSGIPKFDGWLLIRFHHRGNKGVPSYRLPAELIVNKGGKVDAAYVGPFGMSSMHNFAVPSNLVRDDGTVTVTFNNYDNWVTALFSYKDGIQVLYPKGSLGENFIRAGCMIGMRLAFIAIVGVFASTFLSYPVAVLLTMVVFVVGHLTNLLYVEMLNDIFIFGDAVAPGDMIHPLDQLTRQVIANFFRIFPNFSQYDIAPMLSSGFHIAGGLLMEFFVYVLLIRGGILVLAGWLIYRRRELAAAVT